MEADYAVELTSDDERLQIPWAAPDGKCLYLDLKQHPELIYEVEEAQREPALADFLRRINARESAMQSAKCDAWTNDQINPEEEIFGLPAKCGSYIDLIFADERRFSFPAHESLAKQVTQLLKKAPEIPASAEFLIRRCEFQGVEEPGFYFTVYVFGFGDDEQSAHQQWEIGLRLTENALRQCKK